MIRSRNAAKRSALDLYILKRWISSKVHNASDYASCLPERTAV